MSVFHYLLTILCYGIVYGRQETNFANRTRFCDEPFGSSCIITDAYITQPSEITTNDIIRWTHTGTTEGITNLYFVNSTLRLLPSNLFTHLPLLSRLDCVGCELPGIRRNQLKDAVHLKTLGLSHNNFTLLSENYFIDAPNLEDIDLAYNQIHSLAANAFNFLNKLKNLNLAHNKIQAISNKIFAALVSLEILNLGQNQIASPITYDLLVNNQKLLELHLNDNRIEEIASDAVTQCENLEILNLSSNKLKEFSVEFNFIMRELNVKRNNLTILDVIFSVESIDAGYNFIDTFSVKAPRIVKNLRLQLNKLQNVNFISEMFSLEYLDLSRNPLISQLNASNLAPLSALKYLYLENVNVTAINYETFAHQTQLRVLDISNNNLKTINLMHFSSLVQMNVLSIDGNALTHITDLSDFDIFCPNLMQIGISDNKFSCIHLREIVKKLTDMRVSINVKPQLVIRNETNFRGISCSNDEVLSLPNIPPNYTHVTSDIACLNATHFQHMQRQLLTMQITNEKLQKLLYQMEQTQNITSLKIDGLYRILEKNHETQPTPSEPSEFNEKSRNSLESLDSTVESIETTKALVSLIFVTGLVFLFVKGLLFYFRRQNTEYFHPNVPLTGSNN